MTIVVDTKLITVVILPVLSGYGVRRSLNFDNRDRMPANKYAQNAYLFKIKAALSLSRPIVWNRISDYPERILYSVF